MRVLVALLVAGCTLLLTSCHEPVPGKRGQVYYIAQDCQLWLSMGDAAKVDDNPVSEVHLYRGEMVHWCNRTDHMVTFIVSDPKVFSGQGSIRLAPGECAWVRVGTGQREWQLKWFCWSIQAGEVQDEGGGASPGKTDDPPAPPQGGSPNRSDDPPAPTP